MHSGSTDTLRPLLLALEASLAGESPTRTRAYPLSEALEGWNALIQSKANSGSSFVPGTPREEVHGLSEFFYEGADPVLSLGRVASTIEAERQALVKIINHIQRPVHPPESVLVKTRLWLAGLDGLLDRLGVPTDSPSPFGSGGDADGWGGFRLNLPRRSPPDRADAPRLLRNIRGDRYRRPPGPRLLPSSRPNPGPPTVPRPIYEDGTREFKIRPGGRGREMYMFTGRCQRCNRRRIASNTVSS